MPLAAPIVIGNWKMNGLRADSTALVEALRARHAAAPGRGTLGVCPPATLLAPIAQLLGGGPILLGGQDCSPRPKGAYTGDVAAPMLVDLGCQLVIVGHSERRHGHGEDDATVRSKARAALDAGLTPILCIGETEEQWLAGETIAVLDRQVAGSLPEGVTADDLVIAYEPVWAIGTGRTPTPEDIGRTHAHLEERLAGLLGGSAPAILYGGSVKADNAGEILAVDGVDGALVGGASLDADGFFAIYQAGHGAG